MSFSERMGIDPERAIQYASMDEQLRTRLWEAVNYHFTAQGGAQLAEQVWTDFLVKRKDEFHKPVRESRYADPPWVSDYAEPIRKWYQEASWNKVYDLVQYMAGVFLQYGSPPNAELSEQQTVLLKHAAKHGLVQPRPPSPYPYFEKQCNEALEKERSAYRLVAGQIVPLTDEVQLQAVEDALTATSGRFEPVYKHLKTALERLGDRPQPDSRNSMKESISAVESLAKTITGLPKATLGDALKSVEKEGIQLHPALKKAWLELYGYTSNEEGIRHGLFAGTNVGRPEAIYMLVTCSAFVSYLIDLVGRAPGDLK